jgi:signal transduction histidine kinase
VGTQGNGVYLVNEDSTLNINYQHGLLSDYCYSLNSDGKRLWVTHQGGISQIRLSDYHIHTIQKNAGILSSTQFNKNSIARGSDNTLYFGSNQGIYSYDPSKDTSNELAPNLDISSLRVNGDEYDYSHNLVLPSGQYKINIDFKGISMNEPENIVYQYFLEGYQQDWSKPDNSRNVEYKKLSSGNYVFHLKAVNGKGIKSNKSLTFKIKIKYPLWHKTWFQILLFLCFMLATYVFILLREQNLKRIQRKLIQNLDDKTREVIAKEEVIKERKRTEKKLIIAKEKAEESDRLKTAFLSNMSHEIRTPLNAIVGFSTMLQEPNIKQESKKRYLSILKSNTNDLLNLIDDILDISSIEAGLLKIKPREFNPHLILSEMFTVYSKKLAEKNSTVQLRYLEKNTELILFSDSLRVKQILSNLISNAIKFTEKGSIEFGMDSEKNGFVRFFVVDTGIGISENQKEVIFERFRKEHRKGWTKLYRGAGLGLAISKSMVQLLGGKIGVESEKGKGSCFYFILPTM